MTIVTIILMALITFFTRYILIHPKTPVKLGPRITTLLSFSAPAVLTAIWVPIVFVHEKQLNTSFTNPYLLGASVAIIVAAKTSNVYLTLIASVLVFACVQMLSFS